MTIKIHPSSKGRDSSSLGASAVLGTHMGGWKQAMVHLFHSFRNIPEDVLRTVIPGLDLSQHWLPGELCWELQPFGCLLQTGQ